MDLVETDLFGNIYNDNKEFISTSSMYEQDEKRIKFFKNIHNFYDSSEFNEKCRKYSFLNRFYIFKKRERNLKEVREKYYSNKNNKSTPKIVADVRKTPNKFNKNYK